MDSQLVTVDQFTSAISSIQEAIARLSQRDGQQVEVAKLARPGGLARSARN